MVSSSKLDIEKALDAAGSWGRYQKLLYILTFFATIPNAFVALHFIFTQFEPIHRCTMPTEFGNYTTNDTEVLGSIYDVIIPYEEDDKTGELKRSGCKMYNRNYSEYPVEDWPSRYNKSTPTTECTNGITYEMDESEATIVMEFSIICKNDWKAPLAVSMYHAGMALGSASGSLADRFGRRPVFLAACLGQVIAMALAAVSWNFVAYCIATFFSGLTGLLNYVIAFVLMTEITNPKWRNFMCIGETFAFSVGYCVIALVSYFFRQWRWNLGALAIIGFIIYLPNYWLFPESPRWQAQKGRKKDAMRTLKVMARVNCRKEVFHEMVEESGEEIAPKKGTASAGAVDTLRVLFKSGISARFLASVLAWMVSSMMYYAVSVYSTDFTQNRFLNLFYGGVTEFFGGVIGYYSVKCIGRPRSLLTLMMICGVSSVILPFLPAEPGEIITAVTVLAKATITAVFYVAYIVLTEVVPTLQRSSAMSFCSAAARIGSFSAPYLMYMRKYNYFAPNVFMGLTAVTCGIIGIAFLPETKGVEMPDTAEEARENNRFYRFNMCKKFSG